MVTRGAYGPKKFGHIAAYRLGSVGTLELGSVTVELDVNVPADERPRINWFRPAALVASASATAFADLATGASAITAAVVLQAIFFLGKGPH